MSLERLLQEIDMPMEMSLLLLEKDENLKTSLPHSVRKRIYNRIQNTKNGWHEITYMKELLGEDKNNIGLLWLQLKLSESTWDLYQKKGISRGIFIETMKFYSRTVREDQVRLKKWCFQTEEWGLRQLNLKIFRLGVLEYERVDDLELVEPFLSVTPYISIHIPGDAVLDKELRVLSYKVVYPFMEKYFPDYKNAPIICYSWLLSPVLKEFLPSSSKILDFQKDFELKYTNLENNSYKKWVFSTLESDVEKYPEDTILQKKIKKYILMGGKIGIGAGPLKHRMFSK